MPPWLPERARLTPEDPALSWEGETVSFRSLLGAATAIAREIREQGLAPGDPVAVLSGSGARFQVAIQAIALAGCVTVPLNTRLATEEQAYQIADAGVRLLVWDPPQTERARTLLRECRESAPGSGLAGLALSDRPWAGVGTATRWGDHGDGTDLAAVQSVVYTSGTTGRPKGAEITWGNALASAVTQAFTLGLLPGERYLAVLPVFHVGGLSMLWRSVLFGIETEILDRFDPAAVNEAIDAGRVTALSCVSTVLARMLDAHGDRPYTGRLRLVLLGGGPTPEPLLRRALGCNVPVATTYGLTETASQCVTMRPAEMARHLGSAGKALFGTEVRIVRDGRVLPPGEIGEIEVRGPTVMRGYLGRADETERVLRDGYLRTGDLGSLDHDGYLYVSDRRDDLVVTGGENVYPAEVEAALLGCEGVREACVVGLTDPEWGSRVVAAVVPDPGREPGTDPDRIPGAQTLREHLRARIAGYKIPREIWFVTSLPHTAAGKLKRHVVRDALEALELREPGEHLGREPLRPWTPMWEPVPEGERPEGGRAHGRAPV